MSESPPQEKLRYGLTDLGNARRLAEEHHDHLRHVPGVGFRDFTGTHWFESESAVIRAATATIRGMYREAATLEDKELRELLIKHAVNCESAMKIKSMVELVKSQPLIEALASAFDSDAWLFNVPNGTVTLRDGNMRDHDSRDLITKQSPVVFDPTAQCPLWISVLNRSFAGDVDLIGYLQRIFGYCMTGDISEQIMPVGIGRGANGKSLIMDTIAYIFGDYCGPAPESLLLASNQDAHPCDLADCEGKRLMFLSETEGGRKWRTQRMKALTGDGMIKARRMRENFYTFPRTHKFFLITNNPPRVMEDSEAVWRRLKKILFDVVIPLEERDPHLLDKLKLESSGILNWLVAGCLAWQAHGLGEPAAVTIATAEYRVESDPLKDFLEDCCSLSPDGWITTSDLYTAYVLYAEAAHEKPLRKNQFGEVLTKHPNIAPERIHSGRGWRGIELNGGLYNGGA